MATVVLLTRVRSIKLGKANWIDPERRQSIKEETRVKMEWQFKTPLHIMKCWVPLLPAKPCLLEAMRQVEELLHKQNRDIWEGESTSPGCSYDVAMHGRSVKDAQPAVIFSSPSKICRRNAEKIIANEDIPVDPRGIDMEYYSSGPDFAAGNDVDLELGYVRTESFSNPLVDLSSSSKRSSQSSSSIYRTISSQERRLGKQRAASTVNDNTCPAPAPTFIQINTGIVGSLLEKRCVPAAVGTSQRDLDWAVCSLDRNKVRLTNSVTLPNGAVLYPTKISLEDPSDTDVWVHTGTTGSVRGFLTGTYSLVALPGSRSFQRMWIVILDRLILPGDCGSWVIDSASGVLYGHIVAAKPETAVTYIVLARDIFENIQDRFGGRLVKLPIESDFVNEAVSEVKRELSSGSSTARGSSHENLKQYIVASKFSRKATITVKSRQSKIRQLPQNVARILRGQKSLDRSIAMEPLMHISVRESFLQVILSNPRDYNWYSEYLEACFREQFEDFLLPTIPGLKKLAPDEFSIGSENLAIVYQALTALVQELLTLRKGHTLCDIVDCFLDKNIISITTVHNGDNRGNANGLILAAIGWLTMSMPQPILHPNDWQKFKSKEVFINHEDLTESSYQPVSSLLGKFKMFESRLDPPPLYQAYDRAHTSQYFMISTICYYTLREVASIRIIWTEQLPLHLGFDKKRRTLTLFAFPSFARMHYTGGPNTILSKILKDFYANDFNFNGIAMHTGISAEDAFREILLSYRLIFGLDSHSRKLFKQEYYNGSHFSSDFDPLLAVLCGERWNSSSSRLIFEEIDADPPASFYLTSDFPLFGHKLFELHDFVQRQYPSSWRALWHDRRNTTSWWTFWAVLLIGGLTLVLSILQIVLQIFGIVRAF